MDGRSAISAVTLTLFVQEGDRLRAAEYITGSVEVRQLRSVFKLSFVNIARVNRFTPAEGENPTPLEDDDDDSDSLAEAERVARDTSTVRLYVFLTKKKAKTRMADVEDTSFLLRLDVGTEGCICFGKSFGNFDQVCTFKKMKMRYTAVVVFLIALRLLFVATFGVHNFTACIRQSGMESLNDT